MLADLRGAFMLLTRLTVGSGATADLRRFVWAFPVVGLVVNGAGALVDWGARHAGMPPLLAAAWALAAMMLMTGGLHEDGLADTADGFGGGATPARKLEIMRDSRIGSYGAAALLLSVLIRASAIASAAPGGLIAAGMLGRSAMILPLLMLPPARSDGMGATVRHPPPVAAAAGLLLAAIAAFVLLPGRLAVASVLVAAGVGLGAARLARRQVGGHTGDVLGAVEVVSECVVLSIATLTAS
jgi:adenosylcobinamide-GDP ribazoletransferase